MATLTVALPAEFFDVQVNVPLIHQVVAAQLAAARQGTHATKTRGMVSGGGRKPYRQKGTGRARQGSTRAPQFPGGGVVHGPQPRDYTQRTPKKMKAAALRGALSDRARHGRVHVVEAIVLLAVGFGIITQVDNLLRPWMIGSRIKSHYITTFFSLLGGVLAFGPVGIMAGPVLLTLLLGLVDVIRERRRLANGEPAIEPG
jgi:hypothetical protein